MLLLVFKAVADCGSEKILRTKRNLMSELVASQYTVSHWLQDRRVNRDERLLFKTVATKAPFVEELWNKLESDDLGLHEFYFQGQKAEGLGVAYLDDTCALSLGGDQRFEQDPIQVVYQVMYALNSRLGSETVEVCSLSNLDHVCRRCVWIGERAQRQVVDGVSLWEQKESLFPRLAFLPATKAQIQQLSGREPHFRQVLKHLFILNSAMKKWAGGPYNPEGIEWSAESLSTRTSKKLADARRFSNSNGNFAVYNYHTKIRGINWRIHFHPDTEKQIVTIAYIGRHLPTARHGK
ncbi:MAG: hypothetical protein HY788_00235 [Deltaproteobacteria bacterium]|nr:hypothetical protein [Deltaproteobacteria bacterium]